MILHDFLELLESLDMVRDLLEFWFSNLLWLSFLYMSRYSVLLIDRISNLPEGVRSTPVPYA